MCPDHKEEVTHYCKTCQRLVCQLCRVRRTHGGHKITPVLSAYQALKVRTLPRSTRASPHAHPLTPPPNCRLLRARHDAHLFLPPQDKLTKSLTYILGNQDTVQTQICELEETVRHTEVREGVEVGPGPRPGVEAGRGCGGPGPIPCLTAQEARVGSMAVSRGTVWLSPRIRTAWRASGTELGCPQAQPPAEDDTLPWS